MIRPIRTEKEGAVICCIHWRDFPPSASLDSDDIEKQRAKGHLTAIEYQRYQVWKKICGLKAMDESKCRVCDKVRLLQKNDQSMVVMTDMDGKRAIPVVGIPTLTALPIYRGYIHKQFGREPTRLGRK